MCGYFLPKTYLAKPCLGVVGDKKHLEIKAVKGSSLISKKL